MDHCNNIHIVWFGLSFMIDIAMVTIQTMLSAFDLLGLVKSVE